MTALAHLLDDPEQLVTIPAAQPLQGGESSFREGAPNHRSKFRGRTAPQGRHEATREEGEHFSVPAFGQELRDRRTFSGRTRAGRRRFHR